MSTYSNGIPVVNNTIVPSIYVKVEKNSKGYNWEVSITSAESIDETIAMLKDAEGKLRKLYGEPVTEVAK